MASEITLDGHIIAPLNITHPAPALDLAGFQWCPIGGGPKKAPISKLSRRLSRDGEEVPLTDDQPPASDEAQVDEQLHVPGGPGSEPEKILPFPLEQFKGSYAGNGFNLIWVPSTFQTLGNSCGDGPNDNRLLLSLTTEQLTFGPTLGKIPNRGFRNQEDIFLGGLAYLQTVQDTTNVETGKGDKPRSSKGSGIHFEPGIWLHVPAADFQGGCDTICRMASIPHGTTINAQGFVPERNTSTVIGGEPKFPQFDKLDTTPFIIGRPEDKQKFFKVEMNAERENLTRRVPANLEKFNAQGTGRITTEIIQNPNLVLQNAIDTSNLDIKETITFKVTTGNSNSELNAGGTANIAFLAGPQTPFGDDPNAHTEFMTSTFYIERIEYDVVVDKMEEGETQVLLASFPPGARAPTPKFAITAPPGGVTERKTIRVPGIQIQYSQTVNLNFGPGAILTWPHVSVATLVPTDPQPFKITE
ncbi:uncharacterized protein B0I36DRAFT_257663 [Microdochium trichocladiopsis]|uniref:Uncharacterized protein n=1 Tax=Microdochium trichocladiopsis TaxID=1682393 RepID=A0A9P8XST7_9PEZI|nr:uncharacterized protein B0I36DRAFT_257663 [Microdochium trichocladiopsis]KAH7009432.1 hypothetical protein B0I36DRAFT_257663 [Microdochium trichocladiopsis]